MPTLLRQIPAIKLRKEPLLPVSCGSVPDERSARYFVVAMPRQFANSVQIKTGHRELWFKVMAQIVPAETFDVGILQAQEHFVGS